MIFNSLDFLIFFLVFFFLYWFVFNKSLKLQNLLVLSGSYVFYAWWDWRFLALLVGSSLLNFILGIYIAKSTNDKTKRLLLWIGLLQGIGGLVFFKYFNFFISSFDDILKSLNIKINVQTLNIILPLGISFFTFRTLSYVLDVDKGKIKPTKDWVVFFSYVSFFPSLISGPIDKAKLLVPQLEKKRVFSYAQMTDGLRQILWGLFKKVVVADNCATLSNGVFVHYQHLPASSLLASSFFFAIQMYADFSGYSDMAIGFARLIGFNITRNFDFPFFSQNIAEYWRTWHISLTSWLTEYVFAPLSIFFRDYDTLGLILAILINFTIIGMWHGARWTFMLFGFLHGCYYIPLIIKGTMNRKRIAKDKLLPSFREAVNMSATFILVMLTLILFRAETITEAFNYFIRLFSTSLFSKPDLLTDKFTVKVILFFIFVMFLIEWLGREGQYGVDKIVVRWPKPLRWVLYYCILLCIFVFAGSTQQFIYFQF